MGVIFDPGQIIFFKRNRARAARLVPGREEEPFGISVVAIGRTYARIWASLAKKGLIVGAHDLIIAATAISLDYSVITANRRDFEKIEGLKLEGPFLSRS